MPSNPPLRLGLGAQAGDHNQRPRPRKGDLDLENTILAGDDPVHGAGVRMRLDHGAAIYQRNATASDSNPRPRRAQASVLGRSSPFTSNPRFADVPHRP